MSNKTAVDEAFEWSMAAMDRQMATLDRQMMAFASGPINSGPIFRVKKPDGSEFLPSDLPYGPALLVGDKAAGAARPIGKAVSWGKAKEFVNVLLQYGEAKPQGRERSIEWLGNSGYGYHLAGLTQGPSARQLLQSETDRWLRDVFKR